jgi:hypothetical protein
MTSKQPFSKFMHTASNKKWYVRNKRLQAEYDYALHSVPAHLYHNRYIQKSKQNAIEASIRSRIGAHGTTSINNNNTHLETGYGVPTILNPFTSPILRNISYLHLLGTRTSNTALNEKQSLDTNILKKGFQTLPDDHEHDRRSTNINNPQYEYEHDHAEDTALNPLREQERLMEMELSASAVRNVQPHVIESHSHLLHEDAISSFGETMSASFSTSTKSNVPFKSSLLRRRSFSTSTTNNHSIFSAFASSTTTQTESSQMPSDIDDFSIPSIRVGKIDSDEDTTHKLEDINQQYDKMRNELREKSFDSDDNTILEGEHRLNELDSSASAMRHELNDRGPSVEKFNERFQARAYDDLEDNLSGNLVDEDNEATNSTTKK